MRLYMHMGFPKTGTSSIQRLLRTNRDKLLQQGICYPDPGENRHLPNLDGHIFSCRLMHCTGYMEKPWTQYRLDYRQEMIDSQCGIGILSSENMMYEDARDIAWWAEGFDLSFIYYVRNYYDYALSLQKELVKMGFQPTVHTFMEQHPFRMLGTIRQQIRMFGRERFIFRNYDSLSERGINVCDDFCDITAMKANLNPVENANITFRDYVTGFLYQASKSEMTREEYGKLRVQMRKIELPEWDSYIFNALPKDLFRQDRHTAAQLKFQGTLLRDPDWYAHTMERAEKIAAIPYQDLEPEAQFDIYEHLPAHEQIMLKRYFPKAGVSRNEPFLPSMMRAQ